MKLEFERMEPTIILHFKGGEKQIEARMFTDERGRIMHGRLIPGATIGPHTHETNGEIIYILSGRGGCLYDGEMETLKPGDCHYCPKGHTHSLINNGTEDLVFFAVVPEYGA